LYAAVAAILAYLYRQRVEAELRERRARETAARAYAQAQAYSKNPAARPPARNRPEGRSGDAGPFTEGPR